MTSTSVSTPSSISLISRVASAFATTRPAEAALIFDRCAPEDAAQALAELPATLAADMLQRVGADTAARIVPHMSAEIAGVITTQCDPVRLAGILALTDAEDRARILGGLTERARKEIAEVLEFPAGTAGHLMDTRVTTFREELPVSSVLDRVRLIADRRVLDVLVSDAEGRLRGMLSLQALLNAPASTPVGSLVHTAPPSVAPIASRDDVVELLGRHGLATLPVVDLDQRVIGVLRFEALVRAAQHAATDDLQQMVGASKEERALSHPWLTVKSRLPWLLINLVTAFGAAAVVSLFDATIAQFTALAVLLPIVAGQSGNTGAQALAVTSRSLALREIRVRQGARVLRKELIAAVINGTTSGGMTATAVFLWSGSAGLALVIGVSMLVSMTLAALAGALVPLVLVALGRDPATASSIILTTVTDVAGFFSFLGLATWATRTIGL